MTQICQAPGGILFTNGENICERWKKWSREGKKTA